MGAHLTPHPPSCLRLLLDRAVSNSGRLQALIERRASSWNVPVTVELADRVDPLLAAEDWVVTADAAILDRCGPWVNLAAEVIRERVPEAWIVPGVPSGRHHEFDPAPIGGSCGGSPCPGTQVRSGPI